MQTVRKQEKRHMQAVFRLPLIIKEPMFPSRLKVAKTCI